MAFPNVTPTSQPQASALLSNNAGAAGLTNTVPLDRLSNLEQVVGNLLTDASPLLGAAALPPAKFTLNATSGAAVAAAGDLTGAYFVCCGVSAVGAANYTTRTATQMVADIPNAKVGDSWMVLITNTSGGTTTLVGGTGVTITGTATLATNTVRLFRFTILTATTMGIQSVAVGTIS